MADLNKIVDDLSSLTVLEAAELSKLLEDKWGVSAAAPVAVPPLLGLTNFDDLYDNELLFHQPLAALSVGTLVPSHLVINLFPGSVSKKSGSI